MANQVLSIIGPTAVGKTAFAWQVAEWLLANRPEYTGVDFFSADSRQIYQGLEIISGADLPAEGKFLPASDIDGAESLQTYWQNLSGTVRWFGVSSIAPDREWSVAHFQNLVQRLIPQSQAAGRMPIIVGGTGLYVNQALGNDRQLHVPPNQAIRDKVEALEVEEIQAWLQQVAPERFAGLNNSDKNNPRRLVRALEIALYEPPAVKNRENNDIHTLLHNMLIIGLQDDLPNIEHKIKDRVLMRWNLGATQEVANLLASYPNQKLPVFSATGIKPIMAFLADQTTAEAAQDKWITQERQYAKRQVTWWKKHPDLSWFDVNTANWQHLAVMSIAEWLQSTP